MGKIKTYYKRNLPHFQPVGYSFFITFRLNGSLPYTIIENLKKEKEKALKLVASYSDMKVKAEKYLEYKKWYFKIYDDYLDKASYGPKWLLKIEIAAIVKEAIHNSDGKEYELIAYCIMPNHVHLVLLLVERDSSRSLEISNEEDLINSDINVALQYPVTDILRKIKGSTARECNKHLNRSGKFWQHESYDHVIRNGESLDRVVNYVLNNPIKAGLVEKWEDWEWSYYNGKYLI